MLLGLTPSGSEHMPGLKLAVPAVRQQSSRAAAESDVLAGAGACEIKLIRLSSGFKQLSTARRNIQILLFQASVTS